MPISKKITKEHVHEALDRLKSGYCIPGAGSQHDPVSWRVFKGDQNWSPKTVISVAAEKADSDWYMAGARFCRGFSATEAGRFLQRLDPSLDVRHTK